MSKSVSFVILVFFLISLLCFLSLFPCPSYATFMLTSSRTSVPKTQRSTLGNSTTLSLKKERYVNKKSSRHSAVKFVYLFTSFPLFSHTFQSALHFTVHVFVRSPKGMLGNFFLTVFYLSKQMICCPSILSLSLLSFRVVKLFLFVVF